MTIRHTGEGGRETIEVVLSVSFDPNNNVLVGERANGAKPLHFSTGFAYVMNDLGKTVAVYNLMRSRKK